MTVWAFDGKTIAIDSRETCKNDVYSDKSTKLYKGKGYVAASGGPARDCQLFANWLTEGFDPDKAPKVKDLDAFLWLHGQFYRSEGAIFLPLVKGEMYAGGIGWVWAKAAMDLGLDAKEAVKFAIKHNTACGGKIQSHTF